jgi:HprK-related kinase A
MSSEVGREVSVGSLGAGEFCSKLLHDGVGMRVGPFNALIRAQIAALREPLFDLYADYPLISEGSVFSLRASLEPVRHFPRWHRRMVRFTVDGRMPHEDMPVEQALAVLEWGINLVIAMRSHCFLMLHSAVLERNGKALLLPAAPGSGKTTLCAALAYRGWRLLSDEFGLIRPGTSVLAPVPRPMALKNESIDVFRSFAPEAYIGPLIPNTRKGTVAHVKPPVDSIRRQGETAEARWIVFPRWQAGSALTFQPLSKSEGFMMVAMNAFNYELLGEDGFCTAADVVSASDCYSLVYSDLDEAIVCLDQLVERYDEC